MKCEICATLQKLKLWNTEAAHYFQCTCDVTKGQGRTKRQRRPFQPRTRHSANPSHDCT